MTHDRHSLFAVNVLLLLRRIGEMGLGELGLGELGLGEMGLGEMG